MEVKLLSYTPDALNLLLRTKNTRLRHDSDPASWSDAERAEHLAYMRDTIKSSWEFVDYIFEITGVTRSFTHQLVRTRSGAYAQESQRTVDASLNGWLNPLEPTAGQPDPHCALHYHLEPDGDCTCIEGFGPHEWFDKAAREAFMTYGELLRVGVPAQDARDILPNGTLTSIVAKFHLRGLHEMAKVRLCTRTQGLYQDVFRAMRARVIEVHPWVDEHRFLEVNCVSEGLCAFPRYGRKQCKFYRGWMDLDVQKEGLRGYFWSESKQVAIPIAGKGKTM